MVRHGPEIAPDPGWAERYDRMMPIYAELYAAAATLDARLDAL